MLVEDETIMETAPPVSIITSKNDCLYTNILANCTVGMIPRSS
ncbi:uncharacterized protein METZ01_LOCUS385534, partial [marine metagenome]